ncbi:hypothetical protein ACFLY7_01710 [Patescibacteria group bacterium]
MNLNKNDFLVFFSSAFILYILFFGFFGEVVSVRANLADNNVYGYAWSENIGWVSFNCVNDNSCLANGGVDYGVNIDSGGWLSGYAWNDNVGWISFGNTVGGDYDLVDCPTTLEGICGSKLYGDNPLKGWAKVLSADDEQSGGWDGWISFDCATAGSCGGGSTSYGVTLISGEKYFNGYAWGSEVVGWMSFSSTTDSSLVNYGVKKFNEGDAFALLTPSVSKLGPGMTFDIDWTLIGTNNCVPTSSPTDSTWNGLSSSYFSSNNSITLGPLTESTTYILTCDETGDSLVMNYSNVYLDVALGSPVIVPIQGGTTILEWVFGGVTGCVASSNPSDSNWDGSVTETSGTQVTSGIDVNPTNYYLTCDGVDNESSVVVNYQPPDFDPFSDGDMDIEEIQVEEESEDSVDIFIDSLGGFSEDVTLSVVESSVSSCNLGDIEYSFSDDVDDGVLTYVVTSNEYTDGQEFKVRVSNPTGTTGTCQIELLATSQGGMIRSFFIGLRLAPVVPIFEEV